MGVLHYVFDQDFARHAVMKVILPELKDDHELVVDFVREARITAQLEHPNIVPVHDLGYFPGQGLYFTMKFVEGQTLAQVLEKVEAGDREACAHYDFCGLIDIFRKVCDAVAFAHSRQIIHRDIKPHNIMVGDFGEVLLMDWGLGRNFGAPDQPRAHRRKLPPLPNGLGYHSETSSGVLKGSPGYMSPEQARGENARLDQRSDIFLLGATLYHCFTFFPPFMGPRMEDVVGNACECNYIRPEELHYGRAEIPDEVCRIINRAMAPNPDDRYQHVTELIADIDSLMHGRVKVPRRHYTAGDYLMREGEHGHESYVIISGSVEVFKERDGTKTVLGRLGKGDIVGEMAMILDNPRSASVVALAPTETMVLTKELFEGALRKMPPWMARTFVSLTERLRRADERLVSK